MTLLGFVGLWGGLCSRFPTCESMGKALVPPYPGGVVGRPRYPLVMAGPLFQPIRGVLFGGLLYVLRDAFFRRRWGWLRLWMVLVGIGILGTPGPTAGSLEGMIYTRIPVWVQLRGLPEVLLQTLAFSWLLCHWVDHPEKRRLSWCLGVAFVVVCLLPVVGLLARRG